MYLCKICGMRQQAALDAAAQGGAQWCGFIFASSSPRNLSPEQAGALNSHAMLRVGVFVDEHLERMEETILLARLNMVQLHGGQTLDCARRLAALPSNSSADKGNNNIRIIRVLWPSQYSSLATLEEDMRYFAATSHYFLLDAGASGEGGTGHSLCWENLHRLRSPRPWLLAGGLTPTTARTALDLCHPNGLDFNSGLESSTGHKDVHKIEAALRALRG